MKNEKTLETKRVRAEVKAEPAAPGATTGEFDARVAVYGNVDSQGDRIEDGAFDGTVKSWQDSGDPVPVIWSHQWDDPMAHIGSVDPSDLKSTPEGLEVHGKIDLSTDLAKQVHRLMVDRRVREFSFAYLPTKTRPDGDVRVLDELDLIELGPTLKGANDETELFGAKSAIASHGSSSSDDAWDGPANVARLPESSAALRAAHAWVDPDGDADAKSSYKFPHHEVAEDGRVGAANMTASSAGIAALNGGRGGSSIPDDDRAGVHAHLAKHLEDDDREAPELAALSDLDDEPKDDDETPESEKVPEPEGQPTPDSDPEPAPEPEGKVGRVLSKANETKLREARDLIAAVLSSLGDAGSDEAEDGKSAGSADRNGGKSIDREDAALRVLELGGLP